ncbi:CBN-PRX-3 protein [Caenorhabditis brenneri]|uniref:Peroxisomal biogenesis factor 3 n=1 Tax=Caenorhabditis brenneri TaxID=135651 RepID=G0MSY6_CAEBE|nr:CBN-PRX-3 protein [Caenorhabditis brenneri]
MLASAWEFTKRNKGKIIAGGVLIGSAIAYIQSSSGPKTLEKPHTSSELPNQKNVFCRIVSVAFGFSILTLTLKAQISILAADTCAQFEQRNKQPTWQNYLPESMSSMMNNKNISSISNPADNPMDVGNRRIFLQCVQYFTLRGIPELMEYVAESVSAELENWKLTDVKTKTEMRDFFDKVSYRISFSGLLTKLVAPLEGDGDNSSSVMKLLQKLTTNLESSKSIHVLNSLLDFYFSAALKMVATEQQSLVKYVPAFSNSLPVLTSTAFDSPLFNSLYSSDIHQFAVYVFNS